MPSDHGAPPELHDRPFTIARTFDAPRALVFAAFAAAERLARWWGPKGCTITVLKLEFRPGGVFHYRMDLPDGTAMWGRFCFREIVEPERIVWVNSFADADGGIARAPFLPTFPAEILDEVTLEERDGKTTLTLRASPIDATAEERAVFDGLFDSMTDGFGGTWDQLAAYLAATRPGR